MNMIRKEQISGIKQRDSVDIVKFIAEIFTLSASLNLRKMARLASTIYLQHNRPPYLMWEPDYLLAVMLQPSGTLSTRSRTPVNPLLLLWWKPQCRHIGRTIPLMSVLFLLGVAVG